MGHGIAVFELACAVAAVAYAFAVGIEGEVAGTPGRSVLDRVFPFLLGAAGGGLLLVMAVRSWRAAGRETEASQLTAEPRPAPPAPPLSVDEKREVARVVDVLAAAGVFVPRPPDPAQLHEAVAEADELVAVDVVLAALAEADLYRPDFRPSDHSANLAFHHSHGEQHAETLRAQVDDVLALGGDGLAGVTVVVELGRPGPDGRVPTRLRIRVDEDEQVINYTGAAKYLSTNLHVALARILRARRTGNRLAWLWSDQGVWLSRLRDGEVDRLNLALGRASAEGWAWVDEQPPIAAGDLLPPR